MPFEEGEDPLSPRSVVEALSITSTDFGSLFHNDALPDVVAALGALQLVPTVSKQNSKIPAHEKAAQTALSTLQQPEYKSAGGKLGNGFEVDFLAVVGAVPDSGWLSGKENMHAITESKDEELVFVRDSFLLLEFAKGAKNNKKSQRATAAQKCLQVERNIPFCEALHGVRVESAGIVGSVDYSQFCKAFVETNQLAVPRVHQLFLENKFFFFHRGSLNYSLVCIPFCRCLRVHVRFSRRTRVVA
jgi:hypothetical protein